MQDGEKVEGSECVDIDECHDKTHSCPATTICNNLKIKDPPYYGKYRKSFRDLLFWGLNHSL